ncbi:hypothetical protein ACWDRR_34785 [Kitasatospora sp. NPDC003701]
MSTVLIIGVGDVGQRLALGLAAGGRVRRLVLAGRSPAGVEETAAIVAATADCLVEPVRLDALRQDDIADLLRRTRPDLLVQCAALQGPWALAGRDGDPRVRGVLDAGLGLRLPYQLPVVLTVMRAVRDAGWTGPVANLSFPDVTGPVLERLGLAPTLGLGNAGMVLLRARAALRAARPEGDLPLIRVLAQHAQVFDVMQSREPADPGDRCRVHLGAEGRREDALAYRAPALAPGARYNPVTVASALPVLEALLPGGAPLRWSVPAPNGLPGGYPVRIADGQVALDLPPGLDPAEAVAYNERVGRRDGVERIDEDGTVHFTEECRAAVADFAPDLAQPLAVADLAARGARLDEVLAP